MKKCKLLLLFSILLLLTGCSGSYKVTINQNLTIDEVAKLNIRDNGETYDKAKNLFESNNIDKKKYKIVQKDEKVSITYKEKYDSIEDYVLNSVLYKQLFNEINYTKQDKEIAINADTKLKLDSKNQENIINDYDINLLQITIETPFEVYSSNADEQYKNKYTWVLTSKSTEKSISISLNPTNKEYDYKYMIIIGIIAIISVIFVIKVLKKILNSNKF
ncbi:MAG: hypothetical protein IKE73_04790 [Bacilli bacterium]|nr:hypothetical protein [Bacilli bacterium]